MEEKAKPIFTEEIRQLTTSDPGHPDTFNPVFKQVHDNTKYLKEEMEEQQGGTTAGIEAIQNQLGSQEEQLRNLESQLNNIDVSTDVEEVVNRRLNPDTSKPLSTLFSEWITSTKTAILDGISTLTNHVTACRDGILNHTTGCRDNTNNHITSQHQLTQNVVNAARDNVKSHVTSEKNNIITSINNKVGEVTASVFKGYKTVAGGYTNSSYSRSGKGVLILSGCDTESVHVSVKCDGKTFPTRISYGSTATFHYESSIGFIGTTSSSIFYTDSMVL